MIGALKNHHDERVTVSVEELVLFIAGRIINFIN